jgi:citrate lyase subunit beta/citryl-CoA lyase
MSKIYKSFLFVPGNQRNKIEKALSMNCDVVILDLEDAVPIDEKQKAREIVNDALKNMEWKNIKKCVRINDLNSKFWLQDVIEISKNEPDIIMIPKVKSSTDILILDRILSNIENNFNLKKIQLIPIIETIEGLKNIYEISRSSERILGITMGIADFCAEIGCEEDERIVEYLRFQVILAASYSNIQAIDKAYLNIRDIEGLEKEAKMAKKLGFTGKLAIHPSQIEIINKVFTPSVQEIERARKILEAYEEAKRKGIGVISYEGMMVDEAIIKRIKKVLMYQ